jgi:hypothetical protein
MNSKGDLSYYRKVISTPTKLLTFRSLEIHLGKEIVLIVVGYHPLVQNALKTLYETRTANKAIDDFFRHLIYLPDAATSEFSTPGGWYGPGNFDSTPIDIPSEINDIYSMAMDNWTMEAFRAAIVNVMESNSMKRSFESLQ